MIDDKEYSYINNKHFWFSAVFILVVFSGIEIYAIIALINFMIVGIQRHFSHSYDITILFILIAYIVLMLKGFIWILKFRYRILNPSFRMSNNMMEIDRKQKVQFYWKDVKKIVITDKVEFIGMLYNIERDAIIFMFPNEKEEYLIVGKGIYIHEFDKFISMLKSYVPKEKIIYKNEKPLSEVI